MSHKFDSHPTPNHYFIALMEDGVPKFSERPVPHATLAETERELERLAAAHPGKKFAYFELVSNAISLKKPAITGKTLKTTAAPGLYAPAKGHGRPISKVRVLVQENEGNRSVLFVGTLGHVAPLGPLWDNDEFELTNETYRLSVIRG